MIVYIFDEVNYQIINLPINNNGMFPVNFYGKQIANISSNEETWQLKLSEEFTCELLKKNGNNLLPYSIYQISPVNLPKVINLIAIPKFEKNYFPFEILGELSIGLDSTCDISYETKVGNSYDKVIIKKDEKSNGFIAKTDSPNFFLSGNRLKDGDRILSGDYLFVYGLKIIFINNNILINNPNNSVKLNNNVKIKPNDSFLSQKENYQPSKSTVDDETPLFEKEDYFFKSPRLTQALEEKSIEIDLPPQPEKKDELPTILILGPQLTMISTTIISALNMISNSSNMTKTRLYLSYATIGATLLSSLLWPMVIRAYNSHRLKKREKKRVEKYTNYLDNKTKELELLKNSQKQTIISNHPSSEECMRIVEERDKELWQRSIEHSDFLSVRLGTGVMSSKISVNIPESKFSIDEEDELLTKMRAIAKSSLMLEDIPVTYNFSNQVVNAVVGKDELIKKFMSSVFLQLITLHSYTDLKIVVYSKDAKKWDSLKYTPHCFDNQKSIRYFTTTVEELSIISSDLEKIYDARKANDEEVLVEDDGSGNGNKQDFARYKPYYLFYIEDMTSVRNVSLINKILSYKKNLGFSLIIDSESISILPSETSDFIILDEEESSIMDSSINNKKTFKADYSNPDLHETIQKLANIPIQVEKEKYELPQSLSFLEMYNLGRVEQFNSLSRWNENNPVLSLAVPIGVDQSGEIFKMDIHEKAYGPHGLVAGTTGSGKSEWIVTYILSLAVNFSPNEVQFVLIDYKGGGLAMSFENKELGVKLPHLAGKITNLDKSEIMRSISAIESELKRRQAIFNDAREKLKEGSMNIYKYQQFYRNGMVDEPLSHLLIICDEFAELKQQQGEFMDQLISTSRIGRSLGIHLILATQKPSGVVNDQIWSNSKFKVCLKVQDKGDSNEILKKPDAAFLKQVGAFYLQVGNDDYYNLGQSAWAGAKYYPSDVVKHKIDDSIDYIDNVGRVINSYKGEVVEDKKENQGEELLNIVSYISNLSKKIEIKTKPLWLENIGPVSYLSNLLKKYKRKPVQRFSYNIPIGEYDEPRRQEQGLLQIDLAGGNIAIIGQNDSGVDTLLSTLIWSSITEHTPYEIAYYIIDFNAEVLKKFSKFPHVGEVLVQENADKVVDLFELINEEVERRKELLSDYNGSFEYYNRVSEKKLPLMVLVINGYDVFTEMFSKLGDYLNSMYRDVPKYGIIFILGVSSTGVIRQRQLQYFNHTILMQLSDDSQYRNITECRKGLIPKKTLGRGICKLDSGSVNSYCEFQTAFIDTEERELETIKNYAKKCVDYYKYKVKQLARIPETVTSEDLIKYITDLTNVPIGVNVAEKDISRYNLLSKKVHFITGKKVTDNMKFIYGLVSILVNIPNTVVRVVDFLNIFKKPIIDIKLFNEDLDVVIAALEKDVLTRKEDQPCGINIILGAGRYKKNLSREGIDIFKNLFQNIENGKQNIYILVDDYDEIRTIKIEPWYKEEYASTGLWLEEGISNQSFFDLDEISNEDKKFDFEGLGYNIDNKEYKVIKTVLDGDE